jgi:hypothetical protein
VREHTVVERLQTDADQRIDNEGRGVAVGETFGGLARYGLPAIFLLMALLPRDRDTDSHTEVVDFAYSIFVILTLAVLVLGTIAAMLLRGTGYIQALLQVTLIFGVALLFLAWTWDPRIGFSGIGAIFSRYMLTIGMPFEQWVHSLSEYAQRDDDPEEFLRWACEELLRRIAWVRGGHWQTPADEGDFGVRDGRRRFTETVLSGVSPEGTKTVYCVGKQAGIPYCQTCMRGLGHHSFQVPPPFYVPMGTRMY